MSETTTELSLFDGTAEQPEAGAALDEPVIDLLRLEPILGSISEIADCLDLAACGLAERGLTTGMFPLASALHGHIAEAHAWLVEAMDAAGLA